MSQYQKLNVALQEFLIEVFGVFMDLVTRQPYSQDWFVMAMLHNRYGFVCHRVVFSMYVTLLVFCLFG